MKNLERINDVEKKEKPEVLYISAQTSGIEELVPKDGNYRDENEGAVIFSTPDKALASAFLVKSHEDNWMKIGFFEDIPVVVIKSDREKFIENDKGGTMYSVPSDTFDYDAHKGMGEKEWTSHEPVKPLSEIQYSSALDAMIENGIQVYFVDEPTFDAVKKADDYGYEIICGLTSENQKREQNIKSLKDLS